ncbi:aminodeoxychorismate/anthranilate synthase component II [Thioalkalivibrio sp. XN279]|uniref:anthranilate synthase component II n=1 Tax=Thioalkalivibrio sp. XN279 TaxID=2714953 RepID=UPI00140B315B|nr:aminodeoxychorismate/anthranilate synthase component II [Thioalkalivibrio sp. XN279]NHA13744.1 aminodeoxychorismate/anthranilate synthase component II [Thioalkalivibrio sp. XN279]
MVDNYDSFTYNLVQYLRMLGAEVLVHRNDALTVDEAQALGATHLVVSPGPGTPRDAGRSIELIRAFAGRIPVLGVCLGHQAIVEAWGGRVIPAKTLMHGKTSLVYHDGRGVFAGLPQPFEAGRYHSLAVGANELPAALEASAHTEDGEVMGVRHRELPVEGVQFHPESVLTPQGLEMLRNFLAPRTEERA